MHRSTTARSDRVRFDVVATTAGSRVLTHLDVGLSGAYAAAVARVAGDVERALGAEVVANRVGRVSDVPPLVVLRPWREARRAFDARVASWPRNVPVLRTDVRACYGSIGADAVSAALADAGARPAAAVSCLRVLRDLADEGVAGLPIGPAPSAVLANVVLAAGDRALRRARVPFVRWVDDWWICLSGSGALGALGALADAIGGVGLRLHEGKTRIVDGPDRDGGGRPSGPEYHRAADAHAVPVDERPNALVPRHGGMDPGRRAARAACGER